MTRTPHVTAVVCGHPHPASVGLLAALILNSLHIRKNDEPAGFQRKDLDGNLTEVSTQSFTKNGKPSIKHFLYPLCTCF